MTSLGGHEAHIPVSPWHSHKLGEAARHREARLPLCLAVAKAAEEQQLAPLGLTNGRPIAGTLPAAATAEDKRHSDSITHLPLVFGANEDSSGAFESQNVTSAKS